VILAVSRCWRHFRTSGFEETLELQKFQVVPRKRISGKIHPR
jgi:hypothetical protein